MKRTGYSWEALSLNSHLGLLLILNTKILTCLFFSRDNMGIKFIRRSIWILKDFIDRSILHKEFTTSGGMAKAPVIPCLSFHSGMLPITNIHQADFLKMALMSG